MSAGSRRRLDKILDPEYAHELSSASSADLRKRLKECESVESELSLRRRLLHGKLDILRAELEHRAAERGTGGVVERLGTILADDTPSSRRGARPRVSSPLPGGFRRDDDRLVSDAHLTRLSDSSVDEISQLVDKLAEEENAVSARRKAVQGVLDVLQAELIERYKDGRASPADVLREVSRGKKG